MKGEFFHKSKKGITHFLIFLLPVIISSILYAWVGKEEFFIQINHRRNLIFDTLMPAITYLGDGWFAVMLIIFLSAFPYQNQLRVFLAWALTFLVVQLLKYFVFDDFRPISYFYLHPEKVKTVSGIILHSARSFPSGHTASAFAVFSALLFGIQNKSLLLAGIIICVWVGYSRIYLGQHFGTDVIWGALIGLFISFCVCMLLQNNKRRSPLLSLGSVQP